MSGNGPAGGVTPGAPTPPPPGAPAAPPASPAPGAPPAPPGAPGTSGAPATPGAPAPPPGPAAPPAAPPGGRPAAPPAPAGTPGAPATPGAPGAPAIPGTPGAGATVPGASTAGSGAILTFAMKAIKQVERKTLVFEYHRRQAVTRQYAPQSLIGMMLDDLTGPGHFLEVDLDDPFFRSLDVEVSLTTAFEPIGLQSVAVALDYGDADHPQKHRHADLVFDATRTQPQHWIVPIATDYDLGYRPRIEYHFDPQSGWDAEHNEVIVEPGRIEDRTLQLDPTQHVGFLQVELRPERLDPLEVSSVEVVLTHTAGSGWTSTRRFEVRPDSAPLTWRVRTEHLDQIPYTVQSTYHLVDGGTIQLDPVDAAATTVVIGSPFTDHLDRRIDFSVPAGRFTSVVLDVSYDDGSHRVARRLELDGAGLAPARVQLGIVDPTHRETTTQVALLGTGGEVVRGAPFTGEAEFLTVAEDGTVTGA
jgi:hypothetical protein